MLHVASLEKKLGGFSLCIDSLRIDSPGVYGLIGPNGCGKSTLAKLACGILQPDSGTIRRHPQTTMVTQKPYVMDDTVFNNLAYPLRIRGAGNYRTLCDEQLERVGLLERRNRHARELSGGEKQKLALLRAMIFNPGLIILDEAMTDLDLDSLDLFTGMILERRQTAWVVISHQLAHVRRLCTHVFFLANGRLETQAPTETLLKSANPAVRRYLRHEFPD